MKITINLTWAIFWIVLGLCLYFIRLPEPTWMIAEKECVKNGGIPINDLMGVLKDCKIYKR